MRLTYKSTFLPYFFLLAALPLTGCGTPPIIGNWSGELVTEAINITLELSLTGTDEIVTGSWQFVGADGLDLGQGQIGGTLSGNMVSMIMFQDGAGSANLTGLLSNGGQTMSGTYLPVSGGGAGGFNVTK